MWELAFVRPIENLDLGPDGYLILAKVADGSQHVALTARSFNEVLSEMGSRDYEPIGASIDAKTNRWATLWRKQTSGAARAPSEERPAGAAAASSAAQPKRRGRPPKLEAAPSAAVAQKPEAGEEITEAPAAAAPKKRGPGRPPKAAATRVEPAKPAAPAAPRKRGPGRPKKSR